jgi:hypothetical protein
MRHVDIRTTMNVYGSAFEENQRRVTAKIAELSCRPPLRLRIVKMRD